MTIKKILLVVLSVCTVFLISACQAASTKKPEPAQAKAPAATLAKGAGSFTLPETLGATKDDMKVFYYQPAKWTPKDPIIMVFHGLKRNADKYRDDWTKLADKYNLLVICPEFTEKKFPGVRYYNVGNVAEVDDREDKVGKMQPQKDWVFPVLDDVIKETRKLAGAPAAPLAIFAHSAGAQMTHRYVLLSGATQAQMIIPANSGWYTMPDREVIFPYGLKNVELTDEALAQVFAKPVVLLLGEADTERSKILRKTPLSDAQGQNRLERGKKFFAEAKAKAEAMGVPFKWKLVTVPGVGHDDAKMAEAAAQLLTKLKK